MTDAQQPEDPDHLLIDVLNADDVAFWVEKLGVTEAELHAAAATVGPSAARVEGYLRDRGQLAS